MIHTNIRHRYLKKTLGQHLRICHVAIVECIGLSQKNLKHCNMASNNLCCFPKDF